MTHVFFTSEGLREAVVACKLVPGKMLYGPMYTWDVSRIRNFSKLFVDCNDIFKCTDADADAGVFGSRPWNDISDWNTSSGNEFYLMFDGCVDFNQILRWNTTAAEVLVGMFRGCESFNQKLEWDTSNVENIREMFEGCTSFNNRLLWDVGRVWDMSRVFKNCASFNQPLQWKIRPSTSIEDMFKGCRAFNGPCFYLREAEVEHTALSSTPWFHNVIRLQSQPAVDENYYLCNRTFDHRQIELLHQINSLDAGHLQEELVNYAENYDHEFCDFMEKRLSQAYSILKRHQLIKDASVSVDLGSYDPEVKWGSDVVVSDDAQQSRNQKRRCTH
jgi:hypothetical protein